MVLVEVTELLGLKIFFTACNLEEVPALDEEFHGDKSEEKVLSRPSASPKYRFYSTYRNVEYFL